MATESLSHPYYCMLEMQKHCALLWEELKGPFRRRFKKIGARSRICFPTGCFLCSRFHARQQRSGFSGSSMDTCYWVFYGILWCFASFFLDLFSGGSQWRVGWRIATPGPQWLPAFLCGWFGKSQLLLRQSVRMREERLDRIGQASKSIWSTTCGWAAQTSLDGWLVTKTQLPARGSTAIWYARTHERHRKTSLFCTDWVCQRVHIRS